MKKLLIFLLTTLTFISSINAQNSKQTQKPKKTLIVFYSWGGNTRNIAKKIQQKTGADIFEIQLVKPYSTNYNTVLEQAQEDQKRKVRPEIKNKVTNIEEYDTILLGYSNWWASIPMPIATFLESYDLSGKTISPLCSNGGGRMGQSVSAIAKLAKKSTVKNPLSIYYSGGSTLDKDLDEWLQKNGF